MSTPYLLETLKIGLDHPPHPALPLHRQLQRALRQLLLQGQLAPGQALPASRALAKSLGISRDTVEAAYGQLHAEGFIERRTGQGSFVSAQTRALRKPPPPAPAPPATPLHLSQRGQAMLTEGGIRDFSTPRPFMPGVAETRGFPLHVWERMQRQVLREYGHAALLHAPPQGVAALRQAVADYLNLERGAKVSAEHVLILTSAQQAMTLCAQLLLDAGDAIIIEDPAYHGARRTFRAAGLTCIPVPVDKDGLHVEQLHTLPHARAVFLTPSHQYPTGVTLSLKRRLALIEWAAANNAWIIEDDYNSEFHYQGHPTACVQGLDNHGRTLYIGTFSKALFPGLRIGYMVLPPQLLAPMCMARTLLDGHSAPLAQLTLAKFIESGHLGSHIRTMRLLYAQRRDALVQQVQTHLSPWLIPHIPPGGMQLPCFFTRELPEAAIVQAAQQAGLGLLGLGTLYAEPQHHTGLLLGFAAHTPHELAQATRKLASVLQAF